MSINTTFFSSLSVRSNSFAALYRTNIIPSQCYVKNQIKIKPQKNCAVYSFFLITSTLKSLNWNWNWNWF